MKKTYITNSVLETMTLAENFAKELDKGTIITLDGQLASGKTTFTKGFGLGLNISDPINSPTFTISKVYEGDYTLVHIDAYRLEGIDQELGFEDFFDEDHMVIIEWPTYIAHVLPKERIDVSFKVTGENSREISFTTDSKSIRLENLL